MKKAIVGLVAVAMAGSSFASLPALMPMPMELKLTGGSVAFAATNSPKVEVVASIPPEGYELSITKDGVTIRHSDDAGLFYAKTTLGQLRSPGTATLPCLEIKDSPAFRWRGVHLGETQRLFGNWTLFTLTYRDLEWKMWPRAFATAEILWTYPDPAKRDFAEFSARAAEHRRRLIREHVNCAPMK